MQIDLRPIPASRLAGEVGLMLCLELNPTPYGTNAESSKSPILHWYDLSAEAALSILGPHKCPANSSRTSFSKYSRDTRFYHLRISQFSATNEGIPLSVS